MPKIPGIGETTQRLEDTGSKQCEETSFGSRKLSGYQDHDRADNRYQCNRTGKIVRRCKPCSGPQYQSCAQPSAGDMTEDSQRLALLKKRCKSSRSEFPRPCRSTEKC